MKQITLYSVMINGKENPELMTTRQITKEYGIERTEVYNCIARKNGEIQRENKVFSFQEEDKVVPKKDPIWIQWNVIRKDLRKKVGICC